MIDEHHQDLAADYALDALEASAAAEFEAEMANDAELQALTRDLRETAASLAHLAPRKLPAPELRERVMSRIRAEASTAAPQTASAPSRGSGFLPWALAAGLAITTAAFWSERNSLRDEAKASQSEALTLRAKAKTLEAETVALRKKDALATMHIATLSAQVEAYGKSSVVVVWDQETQRGVMKLSNLPKLPTGQDYQLWVVDPKYPHPVNGGVVAVGDTGFSQVDFKPDQPVVTAAKFAISVEPTGGVPVATGPIVLIGD